MNILQRFFVVFSSLFMMFLGSYALARESGMFEASSFIGQWVWTSDGKSLGQISNLVIDKANERVVLAVLSDVSGLEAKVVAIPFASLTRMSKGWFFLTTA